MADRRKDKRTSRLSTVISFAFHALIIGALAFFAAREGMLGRNLKKIAVTMVPKEKPPEKPKEKPPEPKPVLEPPKAETPKAVAPVEPQIAKPLSAPSTGVSAAPAAAPAPAALPAFDFDGGKTVETTSDPNLIYKGFVEYTLRARWARPDGIADNNFVAEVEVALDREGRINGTTWKQGSGNTAWDDSVKKVLRETASIGRPPPRGFPERVRVRFDVQAVIEVPFQ